MILLEGEVVIRSDLELAALGRALSQKILGGAPMRPDASRDETPALSARALGVTLLLHEYGEGRYLLTANTWLGGDENVEMKDMDMRGIGTFLGERLNACGFDVVEASDPK